jgi:hypothetical protein
MALILTYSDSLAKGQWHTKIAQHQKALAAPVLPLFSRHLPAASALVPLPLTNSTGPQQDPLPIVFNASIAPEKGQDTRRNFEPRPTQKTCSFRSAYFLEMFQELLALPCDG